MAYIPLTHVERRDPRLPVAIGLALVAAASAAVWAGVIRVVAGL